MSVPPISHRPAEPVDVAVDGEGPRQRQEEQGNDDVEGDKIIGPAPRPVEQIAHSDVARHDNHDQEQGQRRQDRRCALHEREELVEGGKNCSKTPTSHHRHANGSLRRSSRSGV
jgi:hypothetical protein